MLLEGFLPAAVLAGLLGVVYWASRDLLRGDCTMHRTRLALALAVGAFVLHDMVNFGLFMPSTAAVFWLAAGAAVSQAGGGRNRQLPLAGSWTLAIESLTALAAVIALIWWPVWLRTNDTLAMVQASRAPNARVAADWAKRAANDDPLDALAAADASRVVAASCPSSGAAELQCLTDAYAWAKTAIRRDGENSSWHRLAGLAAWRLAEVSPDSRRLRQEAIAHLRRAVDLNPQDLRLHMELARMLLDVGDSGGALRHVDKAWQIDQGLLGESNQRLNGQERAQLDDLRERATQ
jgi:tetratricopeptide (TPR) repeat protein